MTKGYTRLVEHASGDKPAYGRRVFHKVGAERAAGDKPAGPSRVFRDLQVGWARPVLQTG